LSARPSIAALLLVAALAIPSGAAAAKKRPGGNKKWNSAAAKLLAQFPTVERGHVGFKFVNLSTGSVLAARDAAAFFTPASNTKLYTTALALVRLGPNYRFQTELRTSGSWTAGQTTIPDLEIVGGGDPTISGQVLPYRVDAKPGDALAPLRELATKLAATGIKTIEGEVIGVATRYPGPLYPDGWTIDDSTYDYGAPVSALTFNDNFVMVTLTPKSVGEVAGLDAQPAGSPLVLRNSVVTVSGKEAQIHFDREPGSNEIALTGTLGQSADPYQQGLAVNDPARWAAAELIQLLREQGITVQGEARSQYARNTEVAVPDPATGTVLVSRQSPPLAQDIALTNKVSDNLHAEMLLREVAFKTRGIGTLKAGLEERAQFLQELGITPDGTGFALADGSGLARQDLTTPDSTVALLEAMWNRPERDVWVASLPIGGVDGTLEHRFKGIRGADRVHAKTGSLSHVAALSGYLQTRTRGWVAFSVMVNGTSDHEIEVRNFVDRLCALFLSI
jgi:D-alanyl-D-alanine carboxypeptidase/D-alanyl-D-alanine-endopeptidase (penicillin-binding protein 4)